MSVMPRPVQVLSALMFSSNWLGIVHLCSELYPMGRQFEPVSLMKHLFNSPGMHTWQHFYELPKSRYFETNFGFIPAIWDYLFRTAYLPHGG
jgi:sterol desaturase/sphingolipid hydroxylase (fatty acid hydroxylase superfamily)